MKEFLIILIKLDMQVFKNKYFYIILAMVLALDVAVGKIMDTLTETNSFENSIILFLSTSTSPSCSVTSGVGCNYPLKGGKGTFWEGGLRSMALFYSSQIQNPGIKNKILIYLKGKH